jgi:hypothetical protein
MCCIQETLETVIRNRYNRTVKSVEPDFFTHDFVGLPFTEQTGVCYYGDLTILAGPTPAAKMLIKMLDDSVLLISQEQAKHHAFKSLLFKSLEWVAETPFPGTVTSFKLETLDPIVTAHAEVILNGSEWNEAMNLLPQDIGFFARILENPTFKAGTPAGSKNLEFDMSDGKLTIYATINGTDETYNTTDNFDLFSDSGLGYLHFQNSDADALLQECKIYFELSFGAALRPTTLTTCTQGYSPWLPGSTLKQVLQAVNNGVLVGIEGADGVYTFSSAWLTNTLQCNHPETPPSSKSGSWPVPYDGYEVPSLDDAFALDQRMQVYFSGYKVGIS